MISKAHSVKFNKIRSALLIFALRCALLTYISKYESDCIRQDIVAVVLGQRLYRVIFVFPAQHK